MKLPFTQWILLNIFLFGLGIGLGAAHYPLDFDGLRCPDYEDNSTLIECFQFGAVLGAMTGITIGVGQSIFLRKYLNLNTHQFIGWIIMTMIAFALGHAIGDSAPVPQQLPFSAIVFGLLSGVILGGSQWVILRNHFEKGMRWIGYSTLGFGTGMGLVGIVAMLILDTNRNSIFGWNGGVDLLIMVALESLLVGGIWAVASAQFILRDIEKVS